MQCPSFSRHQPASWGKAETETSRDGRSTFGQGFRRNAINKQNTFCAGQSNILLGHFLNSLQDQAGCRLGLHVCMRLVHVVSAALHEPHTSDIEKQKRTYKTPHIPRGARVLEGKGRVPRSAFRAIRLTDREVRCYTSVL